MGIPGVVVGELRGALEAGGAKEAECLSFCPVPADCSVNQRDGGRLKYVCRRGFLDPTRSLLSVPASRRRLLPLLNNTSPALTRSSLMGEAQGFKFTGSDWLAT